MGDVLFNQVLYIRRFGQYQIPCLFPCRDAFVEYLYISVSERFRPTGGLRTEPSGDAAAIKYDELIFFLREQ